MTRAAPLRGFGRRRRSTATEADRARRTVKGIDESLRKAKNIAEGKTPVKRNRYVKMGQTTKEVDRDLASRHRELAGIKSYVTSRVSDDPMEIIGYYRRLFQIERSFRMAKSDLRARPVFHTLKASIDAHLRNGDGRTRSGSVAGIGDWVVAEKAGPTATRIPRDADQRRRPRSCRSGAAAAGAG